jgi:HK97 family phage major capsid protein
MAVEFRFRGSLHAVPDPTPDQPIRLVADALPYGVTVPLNQWGDTVSFDDGAVTVADDLAHRVKFLLDHRDDKPFGYGVRFVNSDKVLRAAFEIPRDELDDPEVLAAVRQMRNGVRDAVSVGVSWNDDDATRTEIGKDWIGPQYHYDVHKAQLLETSTVVLPRFEDARINELAATAQPEPNREEPTVPDDNSEDAARVEAHRAAVMTMQPVRPVALPNYDSFGGFCRAIANRQASDDDRRLASQLLQAALTDQTTAAISGLLPPAWLTKVTQLVRAYTPTVEAFSRQPLPDSGMTVSMPFISNQPTIAPQATEKTQVASSTVGVSHIDVPVETYAGALDVSIQALARSTPSFLEILMQGYTIAMAMQLEAAVAAALVTAVAATGNATWPASEVGMGDPFVDVAATLLGRIGRLPEVAVVSTDVWSVLGKAKDSTGRPLFPTLAPYNPAGYFDTQDTSGAIRGLAYYVSPALAAGTAVVGVRESWVTMVGPMGVLQSDVPALAGRDVGVYEFAAFGSPDNRGLVKITGTLPTPTGTEATSAHRSSNK